MTIDDISDFEIFLTGHDLEIVELTFELRQTMKPRNNGSVMFVYQNQIRKQEKECNF